MRSNMTQCPGFMSQCIGEPVHWGASALRVSPAQTLRVSPKGTRLRVRS